MSPLAFSACVLAAGILGWATIGARQQPTPGPAVGQTVAALIDGHEVTEAHLLARWKEDEPASYHAAEVRKREAMTRMLDRIVAEQLLNAAAAMRKVTIEELLKSEVPSRAKPTSESEIEAEVLRLKGTPSGATASAAEIRSSVVQYLDRRRMMEARDAYIAELAAGSTMKVERLMAVDKHEIAIDPSDPVWGGPSPRVTLVIFSDFECPYCRQLEPVLEEVRQRFPEEVGFVWKDFPQPSHRNARLAARAARCADNQGQFLKYKDALFKTPQNLTQADFFRYAENLQLSPGEFSRCLAEPIHEVRIEASIAQGRRLGVTGTPTIFVNGRAISGAVPFALIERAILDELARTPRPPGERAATGAK